MNIISLIIEIISGAIGGNVAGAAMKESSLGTVGNSIAGIVGGGLGGTILQSICGETYEQSKQERLTRFLRETCHNTNQHTPTNQSRKRNLWAYSVI